MDKLAKIIVNGRKAIFIVMLLLTVVCAYLIFKVNVNNDMTKYLSNSSQMKKGMDLMKEEFPNQEIAQTIRVMFDGLDEARKNEIKEELEEIKYVDSVAYEKDNDKYNKDDYTLYILSTSYAYDSDEEKSIQENVRKIYEKEMPLVINDGSKATLDLSIIIAAVIMLVIILFFMCGSWIEPVLFMFVIAMAVVLNMGSNVFKEHVSTTTYSIASILQLALSMDYSIILMDRYRQEKLFVTNKKNAMKNAIAHSFLSITSSAFTTFVGLLMLVFMRYKLGMDLGIVLAKGVLCSWLCVLTVLPPVILANDKIIEKTEKKALHIPTRLIAAMSYKARRIMPIVFIALFVVSYFIQTHTKFKFTSLGEDEISVVFPRDNQVVVLYNNEDEDRVETIVDRLEEDEHVTSAMSYPTTLGKEYTSEQMADNIKDYMSNTEMDIDEELLDIIYYDYYKDGKIPKIKVGKLIEFIANDVVDNEMIADELDDDMLEQIDDMKKFADADKLKKKMTIKELAKFFDMKESDLKSLFILYYSDKGGVKTSKMTLSTFVDFIIEDVMKDKMYSDMFDKSTKERIKMLKTYTNKKKMTKKLTYKEVAKLLNIDKKTTRLLYIYYYANQKGYKPSKMTMPEFVEFMTSKVANNDDFSKYIDKSSIEQMNLLKTYTDKKQITAQLSSSNMSKLLGMDKSMMDLVYAYYHGIDGQNTKLRLSEIIDFIVNTVMDNSVLSNKLDDKMKTELVNMEQLIALAMSGQKFSANELAGILQSDPGQISMLFTMTGMTSMTLPEFTGFLVKNVFTNEAYKGFFDEKTVASVTMMNQLLQAAVNKVEFSAKEIATVLGMEESQISEIYILYKGFNETNKTMSANELVNYLLKAKEMNSSVGAALTDDIVEKLSMLDKMMDLALNDTKLSSAKMAKMLNIDKSTMKLLYTLHDSYEDTSDWKLSMKTIINYLVDNAKSLESMMDKNTLKDLKLAKKLINSTVKGTKYSYKEMTSLLGMDKDSIKQLYLLYTSKHGDTSKWGCSPKKLVHFMVKKVINNRDYKKLFDKDTRQMLKSAKVLIDAVASEKKYSAKKVYKILDNFTKDVDKETVELLYLYYASMNNSKDDWTLSIEKLFMHLADEMVKDKRLDGFLDNKLKKDIKKLKKQLKEGVGQLVGDNYSILMISTIYPDESRETSGFIQKLDKTLENNVEGNYYMIGNSVMNYEMENSFDEEMLIITILTAATIFLIVAVTFRGVIVPALLVLLVQCAVYVTVASSVLRGNDLHYIAYLMVQCILMGSTIDYAILFTNYYKEKRKIMNVKEALRESYAGAIHTIFTSGLIIVSITAIIGTFTTDTVVGPTCIAIATGAFIAILLILFVLPGTLAIFDKMITKEKR